jgi:hypothetical protein
MPKAKPPLRQVVEDLDQALKNMPDGAAITIIRGDSESVTIRMENEEGRLQAEWYCDSLEACLYYLHKNNTAIERVFKEQGDALAELEDKT